MGRFALLNSLFGGVYKVSGSVLGGGGGCMRTVKVKKYSNVTVLLQMGIEANLGALYSLLSPKQLKFLMQILTSFVLPCEYRKVSCVSTLSVQVFLWNWL